MSEPYFITTLITRILNGEIRIPSFQRGFVWDSEKVAHLMDSIYKGYPFGTLLFWRTRTKLNTERNLGPFALPQAKADYPIDYVLDGQQRATSIFGVFQNALSPSAGLDANWTNIFFDTTVTPSAQESHFTFFDDEEQCDPDRHFPLRLLFDPPNYRKFVGKLDEQTASKIDELYKRFTTAVIPVQSFTTDDRAAVAIVFERINRLGVKLDTLQLVSAWSWSEEFDLQEQFEEISEVVTPFGFQDIGEDADMLLRCCSAIISLDASPKSVVELKGEAVRDRFKEVKTGIRGAIDFLRANLNVYSSSVLPFTTLLIPLSVFFATDKDQSTHPDDHQRERLIQWAWRTFFSRRYSKRLDQVTHDIKEIVKLRKRDQQCMLGDFAANITASFFTENNFNPRAVDTKTFILMLASATPLDFIAGGKVELDKVLRECNKKEFHHLYPKSYLKGQTNAEARADILANFCILPRASNNKIGDLGPSKYRTMMPKNQQKVDAILKSAICPLSLFSDNFDQFVKDRVTLLIKFAKQLMRV